MACVFYGCCHVESVAERAIWLMCVQGEWRNDSQNGKGLWTFPSGQVHFYDRLTPFCVPESYLQTLKQSMSTDTCTSHVLFCAPCINFVVAFLQVYYGELRNGLYHGRGCIKFSNGKIQRSYYHRTSVSHLLSEQGYDGEWFDDKQHGSGKYYWPNGQFYDGEWRQSRFQGRGTFRCGCVAVRHTTYALSARASNIEMLRYPNGLQVTGMWEQGKLAMKQ
jgi:hypothetical protein